MRYRADERERKRGVCRSLAKEGAARSVSRAGSRAREYAFKVVVGARCGDPKEKFHC